MWDFAEQLKAMANSTLLDSVPSTLCGGGRLLIMAISYTQSFCSPYGARAVYIYTDQLCQSIVTVSSAPELHIKPNQTNRSTSLVSSSHINYHYNINFSIAQHQRYLWKSLTGNGKHSIQWSVYHFLSVWSTTLACRSHTTDELPHRPAGSKFWLARQQKWRHKAQQKIG